MNLSHAVAVVLWEVWKQYRIEKGAQPERPDERDLRLALGVAERLARALIKDEAKRERVTVAIKRLLAKATRQELRNLLYLLSKCANRLGE